MTDTSEDHEGTVSIGGRTITNLRFADDIDGLAGEEKELANLVERLDKASRIAQARAALTRLKPVWIDKSISLSSKIRLMRSRVTSIFLSSCMLVNHGPPQQSSKEEYKPWKLDATL